MDTKIIKPEQRLHDVSLILRDLLKVIKVVSMYPEGNPLPQSMRRSFADRLVSLVEDYGDLRIQVNKTNLQYENNTAYKDTSKEDALAALFFDVGITSITFKDGIGVDEVFRLLDVIKEYQNCHDRSQDLAAKLWEADLSRFAFTTIEDMALAEYTGELIIQELRGGDSSSGAVKVQMSYDAIENYNAIFNPNITRQFTKSGEQSAGGEVAEALQNRATTSSIFGDVCEDETSLRAVEAARAMGFGDLGSASRAPVPNTALILNDEFKLSGEQEQEISKLLVEDAEFDMYEATVELLKEMLHQETQLDDFYETVTICEKVLHEFVATGRLNDAGHLLQYFATLEKQVQSDRPLWAERLKDARLTAGGRDRLKLLSQALNRTQDLGAADMRRYLDNFGWESLSAIMDMLGDLDQKTHRQALCDYLAIKGRENLAVIGKGVYDKRWFVVRNSIAILAKTGDTGALVYLAKVVQHNDKRVRMELVTALSDSPGDDVIGLLKDLVRDPEAEIRHAAADALVARRGEAAFNAITEIINDDQFPTLGQGEQQSLLRAFSISGGQHAVEYLHQLIVKVDLFHDPVLAFFRRAAFAALSENRSDKAEQLLLKLGGSFRPDIRRQAAAALRRRREIIYGGSDDAAAK